MIAELKRKVTVTFRVSESEHKELKRAANNGRFRGLSEFVRLASLEKAKQPKENQAQCKT